MAPWTRIALLAALALAVWAPPAGAAGLAGPDDPVVLSGATVPQLRGVAPADVVAFAWSDGWRQLPVQVDERARLDFGRPLHEAALGVGTTFYTDPATFTGGDPDPVLDADDEIALMARDAGSPAPAGGPAGVDPGSRVQLEVTDPRRPGSAGYAYLFRRTSPLDPAAGRRYVSYSFRLLSGPYLSTYDVNSGPNPELSTAGSAYYRHQFSDRWVNHALQVFVGGATGRTFWTATRRVSSPASAAAPRARSPRARARSSRTGSGRSARSART